MKEKQGAIITIIGGILWGFSGTCGQYLMNVCMIPSLYLTFIRLLVAGLILTGFTLFKNPKDIFKLLSHKIDRRIFLFFAIFGMSFNQVSYLTAISYSDAGTATVLQYLGPILIVLYMCIHERRAPRLIEIICLTLALFGTFILVTGGDIHALKISGLGLFWGLIAALALVFYNIIPGSILGKYDIKVITGLAMTVGGILLFFIVPKDVSIPWSPIVFIAFLGLIILGTVFAYTLYLKGVEMIGPIKASLIVCVEPVAAVLFSKLLLDTAITGVSFIGMIFILGAVILLSLQKDG
ncbi:MAG: DMT family transporter [Tissierellia bacterium]|nr:DMT family transporter [Tissierellia bacterium]